MLFLVLILVRFGLQCLKWSLVPPALGHRYTMLSHSADSGVDCCSSLMAVSPPWLGVSLFAFGMSSVPLLLWVASSVDSIGSALIVTSTGIDVRFLRLLPFGVSSFVVLSTVLLRLLSATADFRRFEAFPFLSDLRRLPVLALPDALSSGGRYFCPINPEHLLALQWQTFFSSLLLSKL